MFGRGLVSIVQYSFYAVRKRRQDNISKEKAAPPREVERLMRLVLDVKRGVPERIQDAGLILGADILSNLSIRHTVQHIEPAFSVDAHESAHTKCIVAASHILSKCFMSLAQETRDFSRGRNAPLAPFRDIICRRFQQH